MQCLVSFNSVVFQKKTFICISPKGPMVNYVSRWGPSWMMDQLQRNKTWSAPHKENSCHFLFHSIQWFSKRRHLYVFPIGSYDKLNPSLAAILDDESATE